MVAIYLVAARAPAVTTANLGFEAGFVDINNIV
jgi:hypothetical protein